MVALGAGLFVLLGLGVVLCIVLTSGAAALAAAWPVVGLIVVAIVVIGAFIAFKR